MVSEFEKWADDNAKYFNRVDFYPWLNQAWDAATEAMQGQMEALRAELSSVGTELERMHKIQYEKDKEIEALRELLLKSSNHLSNVDNLTAAKWGVVGINIINEITQTLEKFGNPTKLLTGDK